MGNTFTSPPTVPDTGDIIAGRVIKTESIQRMGNLSNYIHAHATVTPQLNFMLLRGLQPLALAQLNLY